MSLDISFTEDWGDGIYRFRLGVKELDELQTITGTGPEVLHWRLSSPLKQERDWKRKWIRETIRLSLIGGGLEAIKAEKLCRMYVDDVPLLQNINFAIAALAAVLIGVKAATEGKTEAAETNETTGTAAGSSTSSPSMETAAQ